MRNFIAVVFGVILSVVLNVAGSRLVWLLITGNLESGENKDAIVRAMLWQALCVVPLTSIVVGGVVASIVARSAWWLGGITSVPLFVYGFRQGAHGVQIVLSVIYVGLAFAAAYGVSRSKREIAHAS